MFGDYITKRSRTANAVEKGTPFRKLLEEEIKKHSFNIYCDVTICEKTIAKYIEAMKLRTVVNADKKTYARFLAYNNIRNSLSLAAVLMYVHKRVPQELFFSTDETSIYVNQEREITVLTTEEADKANALYNQGTSIVVEEKQKRVVTFSCTVSGDFKLIVTVIKFGDRNFTRFEKAPLIIKIEDDLYLCLYKYGLDSTKLSSVIYKKCIIPATQLHRERVIQSNLTGLTQPIFSSASDDVEDMPPPYVVDEEAVRKKYKNIALASDGALDQMDAMLTELIERSMRLEQWILSMKYAGGCSMVQQVNDVGRMHKLLKAQYRSQDFRLGEYVDPPGSKWIALKQMLSESGLSGPSFDTLWSTIRTAPRFLAKAFSPLNLESAFRKSGVIPFDLNKILSSCYHFAKLDNTAAAFVMSKMPAMAQLVEEQGMVSEDAFMNILGEMPGVDNCLPKLRGKPLNSMRVSRQRALVVSHEMVRRGEALKRSQVEQGLADAEDFIQEDIVRVHGDVDEDGEEDLLAAEDTTQEKKKAKKARTKKCTFHALCGQASACVGFFTPCQSNVKKCKLIFCLKGECSERYEQHLLKCVKN